MKFTLYKSAFYLLFFSQLPCIFTLFLKSSEHPDPMVLNVTYEYPVFDLKDMRRHANETFNYQNRIKELETKIERDTQLLKMILHTQNIQIQKMTEVFYLNEAMLYHYLVEKQEDDKLKGIHQHVAGGSLDDVAKVVHLDHPNVIRRFLKGLEDAGLVGSGYKAMNDKELFDNLKPLLEKTIINSKNKLK